MNAVYLISHIPKTAGSSLRMHLRTHLRDQVEFIHLANRGDNQAKRQNRLPFAQRPPQERNQAKVILGHQVNQQTAQWISGKTIKPVVLFREPEAWEISRFNQYANVVRRETGQTLSFADWCDPKRVNKSHSQFDWFLEKHLEISVRMRSIEQRNELLDQTLESFAHVLFVEDLPACLEPIFASLNIPTSLPKNTNVVGLDKPDFYQANPANQRLLSQLCAKDVDTYQRLYRRHGLG